MSTTAPRSAHLDLAVLGTVVRVRLEEPADRSAVEGPWELCLLTPEARDVPDDRVVPLPSNETETARLRALTTLTQDVTRAAILSQSGHLLMLHAGALSNLATGATLAYVAPGGTGKTTITMTLGRDRGYVTDETVGVTPAGEIVPYPKPLSVRRAGGKEEVRPGALGLRPVSARPWLAGLMVVRRDPAHDGRAHVQRLGLLDALALLSPETSALAELPAPFATCRDVLDRAGGLMQVTYREASQLEGLVAEVLGRSRP